MKTTYEKPFLEITDVQIDTPVLVLSGWDGGGSAGGIAPGFDLEPGWDSSPGGSGGFVPDFETDPDW